MKKFLILLAGVAALTSFAPSASFAQGVVIDTPVGGVRVGEPGYRDGWRRERRERWRDREVRYGGGCRTVTIQRDDGSMKRIRRCD
jgi:hypothetical protein